MLKRIVESVRSWDVVLAGALAMFFAVGLVLVIALVVPRGAGVMRIAAAPELQATTIGLGSTTPPVQFSTGSGNPNGAACNEGDMLWDYTTPAVWQCTGGTAWAKNGTVTGTGTTGDLASWSSSTGLSNFAGASCGAGSAMQTLPGTGVATCVAVGTGTLTGTMTSGNVPVATGASSLGSSDIADNTTTHVVTVSGSASVIGTTTTVQQNDSFGCLAPALPAQPTVTDHWNPWTAGSCSTSPRSTIVRVQTNTAGSILGSLAAGNNYDIVTLENHGDSSGSYSTSDLKILIKESSDPTNPDNIYQPNLANIVVPYTGAITLYYDSNVGWIPLSISVGGRILTLVSSDWHPTWPLTPSALASGNSNNYDVTSGGQFGGGQSEAMWLRLNGNSTTSTITGLVPHLNSGAGNSEEGIVRFVQNIGAALVVSNEDVNSSAGNRIDMPNGSNVIPANGIMALLYDQQGGGTVNAARWRQLTGVSQFSKLTLTPAITPATLTNGDNPDYNPAGFGYTAALRLIPGGALTTISGMAAQEDGAIRVLTSFGSVVKLLHQSALSATANRFFLPPLEQSAGYSLGAGASVTVRYDATYGGWFAVGAAL